MSNKKLTGTLIPKDNKKAKMSATFYSDKPIGGGDSEIFDEYIDATDQQRNTALANVSNQTANSNTGKMGYKVLDGSKSFASQVASENTIYEIRDVFDLGGTQETPVEFTIPSNSSLKFNGGIIKNCSVTFDNTLLLDDVRFESCSLNGTIRNDYFNPLWIVDDIDLGEKINIVGINFNNIKLPYGIYRFSTPIKVTDIRDFYIDGRLIYTGTLVNNDAAIEILKSSFARIYIRELVNTINSSLDFTDNRTINCIGLCVTSSNDCYVQVDYIGYFNENIRMQDIYGSGCSYNKIMCLENRNANVGIRFYMDNEHGTSWCNETQILGGRFTWHGLSKPHGVLYGIVVAGPYFDAESYKKQDVTSEDTSSNIHATGCSFEGLNYAMYVRKTRGFGMLNCREEGVVNKLYKLSGGCLNYYHVSSYAVKPFDIDFSDCTGFESLIDFPNKSEVPIKFEGKIENSSTFNFPIFSYNNCLSSYDNSNVSKISSTYKTYIGICVKTTSGVFFKVTQFDRLGNEITGKQGRLFVRYIDSNLTILPNQSSYGNKYSASNYSSTFNCYDYAVQIFVPTGVEYMFIGVLLSGGNETAVDHIKIESTNAFETIFDKKLLRGTTALRPASLPLGMSYFDDDLGKFICWTWDSNTNTGSWKNLDGTALS